MHVQHSSEIWQEFPELVPGVLYAEGIHPDVTVDSQVATFGGIARERLVAVTEAELPEIKAWRSAFSRMGLKPTQYRCASESLLRRFRKEGTLPQIHPLIDLCNSLSLAFAIPVAIFDVSRIAEGLDVRHASGSEEYVTFSGETEHPAPREVIFADAAGQAHARRWTNRQSGLSAVRDTTTAVLIVAEAMHGSAAEDIPRLVSAIGAGLNEAWAITPTTEVLSHASPRFEFFPGGVSPP